MAGLELLSDEGFRIDGRKPHELRKIECRLGVFQQPDGSAYIEQGNTKVLAAVYGPHEIRGSNRQKVLHEQAYINCQYSMATFSTSERKKQPRGDRRSQEMTLHLQQTFEAAILTTLYPRSQIDIFLEVLQADGGNYSACVNAATLALIDAGIPMKDFVCSCTAGFTKDTPLVDISYTEQTLSGPEVTLAVLPKSGQIVLTEMTSRIHTDHFSKLLDAAIKGCKDVHAILDTAVQEHISNVASSVGWE